MILASHVIFGAYGFWLPNDPRGSWSDFVGSWELLMFGRATRTESRRSLAGKPHDRAEREAARRALKYPAARFHGVQARAVARGFAEYLAKSGVVVHACSILPEHVHLVIARHRFAVEQVVNLLKGAATRRLLAEEVHPLAAYRTNSGRVPKPWADGQWIVYLDTVSDVWRAIRYVEENPMKERKRPQRWPFVTPYDGRPPRSPLARG